MKRLLFLASTCFFICWPVSGWARTVYCTNCSTQAIQAVERVTNLDQLKAIWLEYAEAVEQTAQQIALVQNNIQQYANMVQNTVSLPNDLLKAAAGELSRLGKLANQVNRLKGDAGSLSEIFKDVYPDLDELQAIALGGRYAGNMEELWEKWNRSVDEATMAAFQLTGMQLEDMAENADELDAYMERLLSNPDGQMQALQAANNLTVIQINELRQTRELLATHIQATAQAQAKDLKEKQIASEEWKKFLTNNEILERQYQ